MSQQPPPQPPFGYYPVPPKQPGMSTGAKIALGIILGFCVVIGGCFACATFIWENAKRNLNSNSAISSTDLPRSASSPELPVDNEKPLEVSSKKLYAIYSKNEVLADAAFKDKLLSVSGKAGRVAKDIFNKSYLQFDTEARGIATIICYFDDSQLEGLLTVLPEQQVEVTGRCNGKTFSIVGLQHCSIVVQKTKSAPPRHGLRPTQ